MPYSPAMPLRFRPPRLTLSPEARWMLLRAFGPAAARFSGLVEAPAALALARRFEGSARLAARPGRGRLAGEMGPAIAAGFARRPGAAAAGAAGVVAAAGVGG